MTMIRKSSSDEIGQTLSGEPCEVSLGLAPSELEALLERMLSCSTRRARSNEPPRTPTPCRKRTGAQWCRLGERAAGGERRIETRFG
jgi:hypothetical protein